MCDVAKLILYYVWRCVCVCVILILCHLSFWKFSLIFSARSQVWNIHFMSFLSYQKVTNNSKVRREGMDDLWKMHRFNIENKTNFFSFKKIFLTYFVCTSFRSSINHNENSFFLPFSPYIKSNIKHLYICRCLFYCSSIPSASLQYEKHIHREPVSLEPNFASFFVIALFLFPQRILNVFLSTASISAYSDTFFSYIWF